MCQLTLEKTRWSLNQVKLECMNKFEFGVKLHRVSGTTPISNPLHTTGVGA